MPDKVTNMNDFKFRKALPHVQKLHTELELEAQALREHYGPDGYAVIGDCIIPATRLTEARMALAASQRKELISYGQVTIMLICACLILWAGIGACLVMYLNGRF